MLEDIAFPPSLPTQDAGALRFAMSAVGRNGGIVYDIVKLEIA
jgi:hypothetical protein